MRIGKPLLLGAIAVTFATALASIWLTPRWALMLDNLHWTATTVTATTLAWLGYRRGNAENKQSRMWFALGLSSYSLGQICWDVQTAIGWNPFPAPADIFYLLLGPCCSLGLLRALKIHLSHNKLLAVKLDMTVMTISVTSFILFLYLARQEHTPWLQLLVLAAYPAGLLSAACFALLLVPFLKLRPHVGWIFLLLGLLLEGSIWMQWNLNVLDQQNHDGSLLNYVFSLADLMLGIGAMTWSATVSANRHYVEWCSRLQKWIPLLAIAIASVTAGMLIIDAQLTLPKGIALGSCALIISLEMIRQHILLRESERLLSAEKLIEEGKHRAQYLAHYDMLTGLPNRLLFNDRLMQAIARTHINSPDAANAHTAVLLIDIDRFKTINDSQGHQAGDALLVAIVERLSRRIRAPNLISRFGGDEFAIMATPTHRQGAGQLATQILEALHLPFQLPDGSEIVIGASIGISMFPEDAANAMQLIRNADSAMFSAKEGGRNTYQFYTQALTAQAQARLAMESRLRVAIQQQQFELHYQPIYLQPISGAMPDMPILASCECLIRWRQPDGKLLPPDQFIPCAEDTGLIIPMGRWVVAEACRQLAAWDEALPGNGLRMAINFSPRQFNDGTLLATVEQAIQEHGIAPQRLTIEITENAVMDRMETVAATLAALCNLGVRIALDDFGTGHSSLAKLKSLPMHQLKIDREFVKDIPDSSDDMQLVASIISMAKGLHLQTVAEGIETQAQFDFLRQAGCNKFQGYWFSRPVPASEMLALITASRRAAA